MREIKGIHIAELALAASLVIGGASLRYGRLMDEEMSLLPPYINTIDFAERDILSARLALTYTPLSSANVIEIGNLTLERKTPAIYPKPREAKTLLEDATRIMTGFSEDKLALSTVITSLPSDEVLRSINGQPVNEETFAPQRVMLQEMQETVHSQWFSPERKKFNEIANRYLPAFVGSVASMIGTVVSAGVILISYAEKRRDRQSKNTLGLTGIPNILTSKCK